MTTISHSFPVATVEAPVPVTTVGADLLPGAIFEDEPPSVSITESDPLPVAVDAAEFAKKRVYHDAYFWGQCTYRDITLSQLLVKGGSDESDRASCTTDRATNKY